MKQICIESCKQITSIDKYNSFFQVNLTVFRTGTESDFKLKLFIPVATL